MLCPYWEPGLSDNGDIEYNFEHFEAWQVPYELQQKEDYPGLVRYYETMISRYPDCPDTQYCLGDAYVLNREYEKAIQFIEPHYKELPDNPNFYNIILDALFALGKNENDFRWVKKPIVLRISKDIPDACYNILKTRRKRKPLDVGGLYIELMKDYLLFKEDDLFEALRRDERFIVNDMDGIYFAEVRIAHKKDRK